MMSKSSEDRTHLSARISLHAGPSRSRLNLKNPPANIPSTPATASPFLASLISVRQPLEASLSCARRRRDTASFAMTIYARLRDISVYLARAREARQSGFVEATACRDRRINLWGQSECMLRWKR